MRRKSDAYSYADPNSDAYADSYANTHAYADPDSILSVAMLRCGRHKLRT